MQRSARIIAASLLVNFPLLDLSRTTRPTSSRLDRMELWVVSWRVAVLLLLQWLLLRPKGDTGWLAGGCSNVLLLAVLLTVLTSAL